MIRIGFTLGLLAAACDLAEALEGEVCEVDDDCWHTQDCVRTAQEEELGLTGLCLPEKDECVFGEQLGCGCMPEAGCASITFVREPAYPLMTCDPDLLTCIVEESET